MKKSIRGYGSFCIWIIQWKLLKAIFRFLISSSIDILYLKIVGEEMLPEIDLQ